MKNRKIIIILLILIILLSAVGMILGRYRSKFNVFAEADIAFFVFETGNISKTLTLESMVPRNEPYVYNIVVSNEKNGIITRVPMEYVIKIKATTNLPLEYSLYKTGSEIELIKSGETTTDDYGVYYISMTSEINEISTYKEDHEYKLRINFPETYKSNYEYADIIELVEVIVDAKQKSE